MAGVFDALRTAEDNQISAIQLVRVSSYHDDERYNRDSTDDSGPYAQEPDDGKLSRPVL